MDELTLEYIDVLETRKGNLENVAVPQYVEFMVNGEPLSAILGEHFGLEKPLLSNYTSVLGTMELANSDRLKIRQLLLQETPGPELEKLFPAKQFDHGPIRKELDLGKVLIYCCAECGDYQCGGFFAKISQTPTSFTWLFERDGKQLKLEFDAEAYRAVLEGYLQELE